MANANPTLFDYAQQEAVGIPIPKTKSFKDLTGQVFGRLTVLEYVGKKGRQARWRCRCECGNETFSISGSLKSGSKKSCGCLMKEGASARGKVANLKHGMKHTAEYRSWQNMKNRCLNPNVKAYRNYGGRGIGVCERWLGKNGFINFIEDMGRKPSGGHTLERVDNSKGYEPSNCCWATRKEQSRNRRNNLLIEYGGKILTATDWAKETGINSMCISDRIHRGWTASDALNTPVGATRASIQQVSPLLATGR